jgi:hypothetical protein
MKQWCKRQVLVMARQRWTSCWEGESYPAYVVEGRCIENKLFVMQCQCRRKEKKLMKKQRRSKQMDWRKWDSLSHKRVLNIWLAGQMWEFSGGAMISFFKALIFRNADIKLRFFFLCLVPDRWRLFIFLLFRIRSVFWLLSFLFHFFILSHHGFSSTTHWPC